MRFVGEDIGILSRIGSAFSYLTGGWGGLIIFVILYFIKKRASHFFTFNVYQSIIISFTLFVSKLLICFIPANGSKDR